jgi:vacuolar-type H+-ATPase subunit C/Vma6
LRGPAAFAFGNARLRARKARLLGAEDGLVLRAACAPEAAPPASPPSLPRPGEGVRALLTALVDDYDTLLRSYPAPARGVLLALLRLHEIENLKLVWRARAKGLAFDQWKRLWRPLGRLATLHLESWRAPLTEVEALARLSPTPYAQVTARVARAHHGDLGAAEMAFDRWASTRLLQEADALGGSEHVARSLVRSVVRERDLDAVRRAVSSYGLSPRSAAAAPVLLTREMDAGALEALAEWVPERGPLAARLPARLVRAARLEGWAELHLHLRRQRRRLCTRAFRASPYQMAPAVAFLLLREEEVRALAAMAEARGGPRQPHVLDRVLAASAMGA